MPEASFGFGQFVHGAQRAAEIAGIVVILAGALVAAAFFFRALYAGKPFLDAYESLRGNLGRAILIGLELLVAADIIGTVAVSPTLQKVTILAIIVLIRTFLSFSLEVEIHGRWPWQDSKSDDS